jgi:hypothetical protein
LIVETSVNVWVKGACGRCPSGSAQPGSGGSEFQYEPDIYAERQMLYSISRRLSDMNAQ